MQHLARPACVFVLILILASTSLAQRQWANAGEYDLYERIAAERNNPLRAISLIREWEAKFPKSEFEEERLLSLSSYQQRARRLADSLDSANRALTKFPSSISALERIATLGPLLPAATPAQIALVEAAAKRLLTAKYTAPSPPPAALAPEQSSDPETARVGEFLRASRQGKGADDPDAQRRAVARKALEWVAASRR